MIGSRDYYNGFMTTCKNAGLTKAAADNLYKQAASPRMYITLLRFLRGLRQVGSGIKDIGRASGRTVITGLDLADKGLSMINTAKGPRISTRLARSFEAGLLGKVPLLKSFGKGFSAAHRSYLRNKGYGNALMAGLGIGKGGIIGNSLAGMGTFTAEHPILGTVGFTLPALLAAKKLNKINDDEEGTVDTMTPSQRRAFDRIFNADGYSGLGYDDEDISLFGSL